MIYPFVAAVFDAFALIIEKRFFTVFRKVDYRSFTFWIFVSITILGLIISPWLVTIDAQATSPYFLWLLLALAFLVANYNLLYFYGLKEKPVSEIEPFFLFNPLVAVLIAGAFYADERFWQIYVAVVIAGAFLAWSHIKKRHLDFGPAFLAILGFIVLYGLEAVILRQLLLVYSPIALYLIRAIVTLLFLWVYTGGKLSPVTPKHVPYYIAIGTSALITYGLIYYSYTLQGISATIFVLMLSPVLVYLLSAAVLKEKLRWKNIITSAVLVGLVIWVTLSR